MANLNELNCLTDAGNTGIGSCPLDFKQITGAILTPKGYEISAAELADLQATLVAAATTDTKSERIFPIGNFVANTDSSEDLVVQSTNYGFKFPVREGVEDWSFQYVAGGLTLHQQLRKFNGSGHDFLFFDAENKILGTTGSAPGSLKAIPNIYVWAKPWKANDGTKVAEYLLQFVFPPRFINDYVAFVKADFDIQTTVLGLVAVDLLSPSVNVTPGSYNVKALTPSNLYDLFSAELAVAGMWEAKNAEGAAITITTVTANPGFSGWVFALNTSDPDYPAAGGSIYINLLAPSVLAAGGVEGYESSGPVRLENNVS